MTALRSVPAKAYGDSRGSALVEFAIVFPVFILAVVGALYVAMLGFTQASMQNAVRAGARCYSLGLTACADTTKTAAYTKTRFVSVTANVPTFTASAAGCGHTVTGVITFGFKAGTFNLNVPLTSTACFP